MFVNILKAFLKGDLKLVESFLFYSAILKS